MNPEEQLLEAIADCYIDPLRFVNISYPWETGILKEETGPNEWQAPLLTHIGNHVRTKRDDSLRVAVATGHGVGKTAFVSWLINWFISTRPHPQIIATANTLPQLTGKTWRELAKWHKMGINSHWFTWTATKFYLNDHPETWFAQAVPWSEENTEAFAGTHERHVLIIMDEASGIPDPVWDVANGAMTTPGAMMFVFGNPTRNKGRFYECFHSQKHRWHTVRVDSRDCKTARNKKEILSWIEDWGEDSDYVRVRVRGEFPKAADSQFIPTGVVEKCKKYVAEGYDYEPLVLGVDVARFGDAQTVLCFRRGRKVYDLLKYRELDLMQTASRVGEAINREHPEAVFVDSVGIGAGLVDRLRQLGFEIIEVNAGNTSDNKKYRNKRAEMWGNLREYLVNGAELPDDRELFEDLCSPEYSFTNTQQIQLERKTDMRSRGERSPDCADALALTFAYPILFNFEEEEFVYSGRNAVCGY